MLINLLTLIVEVIICVGVWVMVANQRRDYQPPIINKEVRKGRPILSPIPIIDGEEEEGNFTPGSLLEAHLMEDEPETVEERELKAEISREGRVS